MDEKSHHEHFYNTEADLLLSSPLILHLHRRFANDLATQCRLTSESRVLSLGCGEGQIERLLAPMVGEVIGLDISEIAIANAREKSFAIRNLKFEVADLSKEEGLAHVGGNFDAVAGFAFLHHLRPDALIRILGISLELLRPDGMFYSTDPSARRLVRHFAGLVSKRYSATHSDDERELDPLELQAQFATIGFRNAIVRYVDFCLGPIAWLLPRFPTLLVPPSAMVDALLCRLPVLGRAASSFSVTAQR